MALIGLIGAVLIVAILNVIPGALPVQLNGDIHFAYVLTTLFVGVVTYRIFSKPLR